MRDLSRPSILFITPIEHLENFYSRIKSETSFRILRNPTYKSVFEELRKNPYDVLFCAPNHQDFMIDDQMISGIGLKCILTPSTGTNHIRQDSVPVFSIANDPVLHHIWSTAEHALCLILSIAKKISPAVGLKNKTLGIIGYGRLGRMTEHLCNNLFRNIIVVDKGSNYSDLFNEADFVSLHMDLNETSREKINKQFLSNFKKNIYLINTSRGEVTNETDIHDLLLSGKLKGYATDVLQTEYVNYDSILNSNKISDKIIITPHIGGVTIDAQEKAYERVLEKYEDNSRTLSKS